VLYAATPAGSEQPVPRVREVRRELLIKLALRYERELPAEGLLGAYVG
jgi:hypothetical protein